jgi:hypothetical protein
MNLIEQTAKANGQIQLDISKISVRTMCDLRRRGHSTRAIAEMTVETAYAEYCAYLGIMNPAHGPAKVLADLQQAAAA